MSYKLVNSQNLVNTICTEHGLPYYKCCYYQHDDLQGLCQSLSSMSDYSFQLEQRKYERQHRLEEEKRKKRLGIR